MLIKLHVVSSIVKRTVIRDVALDDDKNIIAPGHILIQGEMHV